MDLIVSGKINGGFYKIDNLDESRTGVDFLMNPFAIVRTKKDAEYIVNIINKYEQDKNNKEEESLSEYWNTKGL